MMCSLVAAAGLVVLSNFPVSGIISNHFYYITCKNPLLNTAIQNIVWLQLFALNSKAILAVHVWAQFRRDETTVSTSLYLPVEQLQQLHRFCTQ